MCAKYNEEGVLDLAKKQKKIKLKNFTNLFILIAYFLVPIFDIFRMDIVNGGFYLFTKRFSLHEGVVLLLSILFLVLFFVSITKWFGRQFCGWMCPHSTFSGYLVKITTKIKFLKKRPKLAKVVDFILSLITAPVIAFSLYAYFYDPKDLLDLILRADFFNGLGGSYLATTGVFFVLIHVLNFQFCRTVCPYGKLQMLFSDKKPKKGIKHLFKGINLFLLIIMVLLTATLIYTAMGAKGFNAEVRSTAKGLPVEGQLLYTYNIQVENYQEEKETYAITYEGIKDNWVTKLPETITVKPSEKGQETMIIRIPEEDFNKNFTVKVTITSSKGKELTNAQSFYTQK